MEWTGLNELREKYLAFFESKGHLRLPSFPLVPQGDNSLLLINSGMAPMKKYFLGQVTPPSKRVTTCQKCVRTPDIEHVGKDDRHGTYFEMLGNFSFGDYFKHEACAWGWEFVTKVVKLPEDKVYVTIYLDDDEAFDIWTKEVGVDPSHIVRLGKEDNFWEHGSGPCGPCSEIYFDRGEEHGCGKPTCGVGCDCDRYVEFWNIVFSQYDSDGKGTYTPMAKPNIDTGMGLERLACVMQDVNNLFEVDTVQNIMKHTGRIAGVTYGEDAKADISLRVITDHIRSTVFLVGDGVLPSNEGRGYVLRRLLRRAARHGRLLGIREPFLYQVAETVVHENAAAYPDLVEKQSYIQSVIKAEEERFAATIDQGLQLLEQRIAALPAGGVLSGDDAFKLYDTFGFPLDLTSDILEERGFSVDADGFEKRMKEQRARARAARAAGMGAAWEDSKDEDTPETRFVGYEKLSCAAKVAAIITEGERVGLADQGSTVSVVLDTTPFYAESGGQVGDTGLLTAAGVCVQVTDCRKSPTGRFLHIGKVVEGSLSAGETMQAQVDAPRRRAVMRNHSAAHLLQAALRSVLGTHVQQAGQLVNDRHVRFDFTHFAALTADELAAVEKEVNTAILSALPVVTRTMAVEEAKKTGAMALFSEKYGDVVRVVQMGDVSKELCGGTHVDNTGKIGLFRIVSETSVSAGVRRIEAVTGTNVLELLRGQDIAIKEAAQVLKAAPAELPQRAAQVAGELREKDRVIETLRGRIAAMQMDALLAAAKEVGVFRLITASLKEMDVDGLRMITDRVRESDPQAVIVLAGMAGGKVVFAAACGKEAVKNGAHAGNLLRTAAKITGGGGGGRPDSATAGGRDASRVAEALQSVEAGLEAVKK
ncbi:alanine--tRNA ligase [Ethanoligenens harbinense]|uniref:Alanine--tRNA ligase n=1 Tax=Ethanoligenens harbinense (strain DSM 18485 / JCM 12961 / CGMCC 1.5033 / YUAN-3) TaxID=663278 RepID=E6U3K9_ETHHY|nr:alanine--tRNA ligase [Ethanoligenens harbinense]ADU27609.1 alanyl-tRNA synthetase [Ethanoligenens harbinense YUAN-3]AVQ96653.1 alanine--tRNA ligase [Ethanoligenens harbinense YUAN-3]AYF42138.1 alanine--tRNA ligase [Ethanoligenens harbinense]QCN92893.1 alanine--tRNA ligase [Ethanoligenens harbinense]